MSLSLGPDIGWHPTMATPPQDAVLQVLDGVQVVANFLERKGVVRKQRFGIVRYVCGKRGGGVLVQPLNQCKSHNIQDSFEFILS